MIFDRALATPRDDDDLVASRRHRLFHAILNDGLIHQRQHLFRLSLSGWEKTRAQSGGRENRFADDPVLAALAVCSSFVRRFHRRIFLNRIYVFFYSWRTASSRVPNSSSKSRSVCNIPSALSILIENFSVPSGVNCVPRCDATKRASFSASIAAVWLNFMLTNSRLRSMALAPTRMACNLSAAYSNRLRTARGVSP